MKLLVYGSDPFLTGLTSILTAYDIELIDVRSIKDIPVSLARYGKPDLALIEKKAEAMADIVTFIRALWDIPIVLLVGAGKEEWRGLDEFKVDGYVNNTFSGSELLARLSAIQRRITAGNKELIR